MRFLKLGLKLVVFLLAISLVYFLVSLVLMAITIPKASLTLENNRTIYLSSNGVHLDIVIPKSEIDLFLLEDLKLNNDETYIAFGWGDENFYINTPTWGDLTFRNAIKAMFLKSTTLMHVTKYKSREKQWLEIKVNDLELEKLIQYIDKSFKEDIDGKKIILEGESYSINDNFYKAIGSYSCLKTCNTWVNKAFISSGLKACAWTPFDYGLMKKYK